MSPAITSAHSKGSGERSWPGSPACGRRRRNGASFSCSSVAPGGLFERALAADQRQGGQGEVDDRVGVAHAVGVAAERLGQAGVVEAGRHQDALLGKDARLGAVGQDDGPAFQPGADAAAVDDGRLGGERRQGAADLVRALLAAQLERGREAVEGDAVHAAVELRDQGAGACRRRRRCRAGGRRPLAPAGRGFRRRCGRRYGLPQSLS